MMGKESVSECRPAAALLLASFVASAALVNLWRASAAAIFFLFVRNQAASLLQNIPNPLSQRRPVAVAKKSHCGFFCSRESEDLLLQAPFLLCFKPSPQ
jgi:hypothetical protein